MKGYSWHTLLFLLSLLFFTRGRYFSKCELANELLRQGFPRHQLRDWICLIEAESSRITDRIGGPDEDGSYDYGLFQINDRYWCYPGDHPGKECYIRCLDLLTDDITLASSCAKKIYKVQGFEAWVGWVNECQNKAQSDLTECRLFNVNNTLNIL